MLISSKAAKTYPRIASHLGALSVLSTIVHVDIIKTPAIFMAIRCKSTGYSPTESNISGVI
jgi:hypothetical protein